MPKCKDCKHRKNDSCIEYGYVGEEAEVCDHFEQKPETDNVNHPAHYTQGGVECIEALEAATEGLKGIEAVCTANAIKYLWRWKRKNGIEDLRKAVWYIERLIARLERVK